jgi:hypothetical protein
MTAKTVSLLLLGAMALSACTQAAVRTPQPVGVAATLSPSDRLIAAIETEGCVLSRDNVGAVLLRANLTQADLPGITAGLQQQGRIESVDGSSIRVLSNNCI